LAVPALSAVPCVAPAPQAGFALEHVPLPDARVLPAGGFEFELRFSADPPPALQSAPTAVWLEYVVDHGRPVVRPMRQVPGQSGKYSAIVTGIRAPASVAYRFHVDSFAPVSGMLRQQHPEEGEDPIYFHFYLGAFVPLYANDFEGTGDHGWTHGMINVTDDWQRGAPQGKEGVDFGVAWKDPDAAASGSRCWGNDLGFPGWNGAYDPFSANFLLSPVLDASLPGIRALRLRFRCALSADQPANDLLRVQILHPLTGQVLDEPFAQSKLYHGGHWYVLDLDISAAAGGPFQIRFDLSTNASVSLGGWSVDDVEVLALYANDHDDRMTLRGNTAVSAGDVQAFHLSGATPHASYELRHGPRPDGPFQLSLGTFTAGADGRATISIGTAGSLPGDSRWFKAVRANESSNPLPVTIH
jgi:hypothetical protein